MKCPFYTMTGHKCHQSVSVSSVLQICAPHAKALSKRNIIITREQLLMVIKQYGKPYFSLVVQNLLSSSCIDVKNQLEAKKLEIKNQHEELKRIKTELAEKETKTDQAELRKIRERLLTYEALTKKQAAELEKLAKTEEERKEYKRLQQINEQHIHDIRLCQAKVKINQDNAEECNQKLAKKNQELNQSVLDLTDIYVGRDWRTLRNDSNSVVFDRVTNQLTNIGKRLALLTVE